MIFTIGDQDIDLSPTFTIFLSRDPTVEFPPDICSRVTFVNFMVTRSSLQPQCLNQVLKAERPDIDHKCSDLKLQGEFQLRLRHLEKNLLSCLNEAKGRILDDDNIIKTLEILKKEAAEVGRKVAETDQVMAEIDNTSRQYHPLRPPAPISTLPSSPCTKFTSCTSSACSSSSTSITACWSITPSWTD